MRCDRRVIVSMALASAYERPQDVGAEEDEHDADTEFEDVCQAVGQLVTQQKDDDAGNQQRERVPETPQSANERRAQQTAPLRHDGGNRRQMVGIERMAKS